MCKMFRHPYIYMYVYIISIKEKKSDMIILKYQKQKK